MRKDHVESSQKFTQGDGPNTLLVNSSKPTMPNVTIDDCLSDKLAGEFVSLQNSSAGGLIHKRSEEDETFLSYYDLPDLNSRSMSDFKSKSSFDFNLATEVSFDYLNTLKSSLEEDDRRKSLRSFLDREVPISSFRSIFFDDLDTEAGNNIIDSPSWVSGASGQLHRFPSTRSTRDNGGLSDPNAGELPDFDTTKRYSSLISRLGSRHFAMGLELCPSSLRRDISMESLRSRDDADISRRPSICIDDMKSNSAVSTFGMPLFRQNSGVSTDPFLRLPF
uniref:Uncharacterized protein n=1 Tax=Compsopogon caeruleus TaxID=31354 RepID=A0A6T6CN69_9RHOD|mmetsp:Transcript_8550/g.17322  ORF Transcript_8550/g.17322 Transcript_8550/m.17322 type:complete len:278 (+) Transcript_8550:829-1662(+)